MEQTDIRLAAQEIPCILYNPKVHYPVHKIRLLGASLGELNTIDSTKQKFLF
jgi:hypothetical protein